MEPVIGDALGDAMLSFLEGSGGGYVLERDDGWIEVMDAGVYFAEPGEWAAGESAVLGHIKGRVLDIGAGAGRYAVELERTGHEVTAIDVSRGAVEICLRRGIRDANVGSLYDIGADQRFDTFLLGGHNLGLLESPTVAPRFLARLRMLANSGARIVGTSRSPQTFVDRVQVEYMNRNSDLRRAAGQFRFRVRRALISTRWFEYWYMAPDEFACVASESGWHVSYVEPFESGSYFAVAELA